MKRRLARSKLATSFVIAIISCIGCDFIAFAQSADEPEHGEGLVLTPKEKLDSIPKAPVYRDSLPESVDLSRFIPEPSDQGRQGSCTAWAVGYAARAYYSVKVEKNAPGDYSHIPSPAYIYNSTKGPGSCVTTGTSIDAALDLLRTGGSLSLDAFPYDEGSCGPPDPEARRKATDFRIDGYNRLDERNVVDNIKGELAKGNPVILAIRTTRAFHRLKYGEIYNRPTECMAKDGHCNHAITAVGYDDRKQAFRLINSWGPKWSTGGYGWVDYETLKGALWEAYVMRVNLPPPPPVCSLTSDRPVIIRGETATLSYHSENATDVEFDNGLGSESGLAARSSEGIRTISPQRTTSYTATFKGRGGKTSCSASVVVQEPRPVAAAPVISSFTVSPATMLAGQSARLTWAVAGATALKMEPGAGALGGGSATVRPGETTTYILTASNPAGSTAASATVTVNIPKPIDLPDLECSKISLQDQGGKRTVFGFVKDPESLEKLKQAVPDAQLNVQVRPFPQCEALVTLDRSLNAVERPTVSIRKTGKDSLSEREPLIFEIKTPPYPSYVNIAYVQADGSVRNLIQPGEGGSIVMYPPNSRIVIGDGSGGAKKFFVTEPFGEEMVIVTAGRSPLFPEPRPRLETEREYLSALRRALIYKPIASAPDRDVVAAIDTVLTKARANP